MEAKAVEAQKCAKGEVIFRQGDPGNCMYDLLQGRVGIYANYGAANEKLLTELHAGDSFGEMAMIEAQPRSATAVALQEGTRLTVITWETLGSFFREQPAKVVVIMQQMARRIRELTQDYMDACGAITEMVEKAEAEKKSAENAWVKDKMRRYLDAYGAYQTAGGPGRKI